MKSARYLVSKKKLRTVDKGVPQGSVDLDLTEIHPGLVCMGYPACGVEALYRNKYNDVLRYLDYKYGDAYMVYNLCREAAYHYSPDKFHNRVRCFPFFDHAAAPLRLMPAFVKDAAAYLTAHPGSTAVIHCKAGKGRTGVMACCLLLAREPRFAQSAEAVMAYYGGKRTRDGKGLTVPSQRRSVAYYAQLLRDYGGEVPPTMPIISLRRIRLVAVPRRWSLHTFKLFVDGEEEPIVASRLHESGRDASVAMTRSTTTARSGAEAVIVSLTCDAEPRLRHLSGDLRFEFLGSGGALLGALSIHTLFVQTEYPGTEVDKLAKECGEDCRVELDYATEPPLP